MSKFLEEIKARKSYYYVDEHYELNDYVIFVAFIFIVIGLAGAEFIYTLKDDSVSTKVMFVVTDIAFTAPFIAHFFLKIVKMGIFKMRKKRCIEKGTMYRGRFVSQEKDRKLFESKAFGKEIYTYRPVVEYYCKGEKIREVSKYAFTNRYADVLSDAKVTVYKYKDDMILEDIILAKDKYSTIKNVSRGTTFWAERNREAIDLLLMIWAIISIFGWLAFFVVKIIAWYYKYFA